MCRRMGYLGQFRISVDRLVPNYESGSTQNIDYALVLSVAVAVFLSVLVEPYTEPVVQFWLLTQLGILLRSYNLGF